ncbi:hypothetical protein [Methanolobus profundi]|uniref:Uncharacterized protein n=1 Tax=Methanolobus profundi TaxID=487685 RepID=A0A1I4TN61_9EURY|nr:hypothetical protein [Methanolobus profundi]SFM78194.1 hypothetical protein SAMN04488696_2360 [Methanolobus profundi]
MKKLPLVLIGFLVAIVLISGMADQVRHSDVHGKQHDILSQYSSYISEKDISDDKPSPTQSDLDISKDEKVFLSENIAKSTEMVERLEVTVAALERDGNDVQELEQMINDYASLVSESNDYLSKADASSSSSDEIKYLAMSRDKIILADKELKDIFNIIHSYLPGPVELSEDQTLTLEGDGIVILSGDIDVDLGLSEGKFSIVDFSGDLMVDADQLSSYETMPDQVVIPDSQESPHNMVSYNDASGNVTVSGSLITVAVMGNDLSLIVEGTGEAELFGNGTYSLENSSSQEEGIWIPSIFEMK